MINKELEITIEATIRDAEIRRHEYLTVEHILFAVLHDEWGIDIIMNCGGDIAKLKGEVEGFFERNIPRISAESESYPEPTIAFRRVFQTAVNHIKSSEKPEADAGDILSAIFQEKDSHAVHFLISEGITRLDVLNSGSHGFPRAVPEPLQDPLADDGRRHERRYPSQTDPLEKYTVGLVNKCA